MSNIGVMSCDYATLYCMLLDQLYLRPHTVPLVPMANRVWRHWQPPQWVMTHSLIKPQTTATLWGYQIWNTLFPLYLSTPFSWIFYEPSPWNYTLAKNLSTQNNFASHAKNMQCERCMSTHRNLPTLPFLRWIKIRERCQTLWERK
jgi:hypothetical protein